MLVESLLPTVPGQRSRGQPHLDLCDAEGAAERAPCIAVTQRPAGAASRKQDMRYSAKSCVGQGSKPRPTDAKYGAAYLAGLVVIPAIPAR
jgi:hypothetical protein